MGTQISIVIATWNASETLRNCLGSIVSQLTDECELVIIDGGSTDNTVDIISDFKEYIYYTVSEKDNGIYDAWNKGVKISRGKWIAFIGADDVLLPNAIETYLKVIKETDSIDEYDYICARNEYVDKEGSLIKLIGNKPNWKTFRKRMNAAHVASLHNKTNLFGQIGYYDLSFKICADYELLMRKKDKLKCLFIPNHIAQMQIGGMSFSTKAIVETFWIRHKYVSVPFLYNVILFAFDWLKFKSFVVRKKIMGYHK